jgi:cyclophilin family peptidyl-prolyl cis-trans isomerase
MRSWLPAALVGALVASLATPAAAACDFPNPDDRSRVEVVTVLGSLCFDLLDRPGEAPGTVDNFLGYVARGDYDGTFFHRLIPDFVLQGGGYRYDPVDRYQAVTAGPMIQNEPGISNLRGTVAMAKLAGQPNSATHEWFVNVVDNVALDTNNGGFTVFARVLPQTLPVLDALAELHTEYGPFAILDDTMPPVTAAFTNLPVLELLERNPDGYGCLKVFPDPTPQGQPRGEEDCANQAEFDAAVQLTREALDPQVPERLVTISSVVPVPEPGAPLLAAVGAGILAGARALRGRREVAR